MILNGKDPMILKFSDFYFISNSRGLLFRGWCDFQGDHFLPKPTASETRWKSMGPCQVKVANPWMPVVFGKYTRAFHHHFSSPFGRLSLEVVAPLKKKIGETSKLGRCCQPLPKIMVKLRNRSRKNWWQVGLPGICLVCFFPSTLAKQI